MSLSARTGWTRTEILDLTAEEACEAISLLADIPRPPSG